MLMRTNVFENTGPTLPPTEKISLTLTLSLISQSDEFCIRETEGENS